MLLVANFADTKWCKKVGKCLKHWHMGTHLKVLGESYLMNTNMTGIRWLSKIVASFGFGWLLSSLRIGRVKIVKKFDRHDRVKVLIKQDGEPDRTSSGVPCFTSHLLYLQRRTARITRWRESKLFSLPPFDFSEFSLGYSKSRIALVIHPY